MTEHKIVIGDSRRIDHLPDHSVDLIITSPPYWQLKDYGVKEQIGFHDTYEEYINNLNLVWLECSRVLKDGCRLCINIGDQFARSAYYGRYKVIPIRTEIIKFCESIGFDYMGAIMWQKVTTTNTTGGGVVMGSYPYPRNGIIKIDYEFILVFKKYGKPPKVDSFKKEKSKMSPEEWNEFFSGHWNFPGERQGNHLAMFPLELPTRLIRMFSFVGDVVLDPFLGSGTTSLAAGNLLRNSIGYEINEEYLPIIREKLGVDNVGLFNDRHYSIIKQSNSIGFVDDKLERQPYRFKDLVKLDKKAASNSFLYGSKIDGHENSSQEYYSIKDIVSCDTIILNTGEAVKLMGIQISKDKHHQAVDYLRKKTRGQKVFIRFDEKHVVSDGVTLGYVYLRNKTFINAHMIKAGIARPDDRFDHRYAKKFRKYWEEFNG